MNKTKIDTQIKTETDSKKTITLKYMPELHGRMDHFEFYCLLVATRVTKSVNRNYLLKNPF